MNFLFCKYHGTNVISMRRFTQFNLAVCRESRSNDLAIAAIEASPVVLRRLPWQSERRNLSRLGTSEFPSHFALPHLHWQNATFQDPAFDHQEVSQGPAKGLDQSLWHPFTGVSEPILGTCHSIVRLRVENTIKVGPFSCLSLLGSRRL